MGHDDNSTLGTWDSLDGEGSGPAVVDPAALKERYADRGLLGRGGMGEVRRVYDRELGREVAMKLLKADRLHATSIARFLQEARVHAGLQHPGIVPLHDLGRLSDGRLYFTMPVIHGRTLHEAIEDGLGLSALIAAFHQVCLTVAYAHGQGVLHRDLKPSNVMLGAFGEVLVVDWGIAQVQDREELEDGPESAGLQTRVGQVKGSPRFMAPEQARGEVDALSAATDVYGLGAILYQILAGVPPFADWTSGNDVVAQVASGTQPAPPSTVRRVPEELEQLCTQAMASDPTERFADAASLAARIGAWRDGVARRKRADLLVDEGVARLAGVEALRGTAAAARHQASVRLAELGSEASLADKREVWAQEAEAERIEREARIEEAEGLALLRAALSHDPETPGAHRVLADHFRAQHAKAESDRDPAAAAALEVHLRAHDRTGLHGAYLSGTAWLTLHTAPEGAEVELFELVERDRQWVPESRGVLGTTPLDRVPLERGRWLCLCRKPGHEDVRVPVFVGRLDHWDGIAPGEQEPHPIPLPAAGSLGPDDCYVPAGWAWLGGGDRGPQGTPQGRMWVDGFVMRRHPVTNRELLGWLDQLAEAQGLEAALRCVPRDGVSGEGAPIYAHQDGRFVLRPDGDGDLWDLDWPVFQVDWHTAAAVAGFLGWRLPTEWEREKAARGVDGRLFPWGDHPEALFGKSRLTPGPAGPARVGHPAQDRSIYGVAGLGGNVTDWCWADTTTGPLPERHVVEAGEGPQRAFRGGAWDHLPPRNASHRRFRNRVGIRLATLSFRLARSVER